MRQTITNATQMHTNNKKQSFLNLAEHYLRKGNVEKHAYYLHLADVTTPNASVSDNDSQGRSDYAQPQSLCPSDEALIQLFSQSKYELILELNEHYPQHKLLPYLASSIYFTLGRPDLAAKTALDIKAREERRLREKTAEMWDALHAPLVKEPRVHLIILCHNRERHVEQALRQLAATNYGNYAVYLADNGSSDNTWEVVQKAVKHFPEQVPVAMERFPTNIGRPAGHNWLLTKHDHSGAEYIAIGDDDLVEVPPDWLTRMVQTAKAFPKCGVVGGKALNPGKPNMIHGGVRNILKFTPEELEMSNNDDILDFGQFDYVDKVDHVIGCLHIYDRNALEEMKLFDIRYSPCQFVDINHHLRFRMAGYDIIFNGLISFRHLRGMGKEGRDSVSLAGNAFGNIYKLLHKFDEKEVNAALQRNAKERLAWLFGESLPENP
ncbi:MAG: glycosyltransferase family 2 protein [Verrucomicrobiae bacterium]|nr:glycosyltransferase family 2 protein [Verrucomicrobiae bacterium]